MAWDNAANIINDAAVELGLYSADVADPYDSTDANLAQLCRFLKSIGQDLARDYAWTHLQKTHVFETVDGFEAYDLPDDYARMIDQTGWNRSNLMPLLGPLAAQGWQALKSLAVSGTADRYFRIVGDMLHLHPVPTGEEQVAYEYVSRYWVRSLDAVAPDKEATDSSEDTLYFDRRLLVTALKLRWKRAKGFDSTAEQEDYERALTRAQGGDGAAPILRVGGRSRGLGRLLDTANVPESNWGV